VFIRRVVRHSQSMVLSQLVSADGSKDISRICLKIAFCDIWLNLCLSIIADEKWLSHQPKLVEPRTVFKPVMKTSQNKHLLENDKDGLHFIYKNKNFK
jgi:hypothetical protein